MTQVVERNWQTLATCRSADPDLFFLLPTRLADRGGRRRPEPWTRPGAAWLAVRRGPGGRQVSDHLLPGADGCMVTARPAKTARNKTMKPP